MDFLPLNGMSYSLKLFSQYQQHQNAKTNTILPKKGSYVSTSSVCIIVHLVASLNNGQYRYDKKQC